MCLLYEFYGISARNDIVFTVSFCSDVDLICLSSNVCVRICRITGAYCDVHDGHLGILFYDVELCREQCCYFR